MISGSGIGLRPPHYAHILENHPNTSWFEAVSENYMGIEGGAGGRPLHYLKKIRENYPIVLHGVSLSIGSADPINKNYLTQLKDLIHQIEPALISDHLCWTGVDGENLHDLLPLPYTQEALNLLISKTLQVQDFLDRPILLENVSSYLTFQHSEMPEWEFLSEVSKRAGCGILLDINNVYVSAINHQFDPLEYIQAIPKERVGYLHFAGYSKSGKYLIDTHDHPVSEAVWDLFAQSARYLGKIPTLIEWDANIPDFSVLEKESLKAKQIQEKAIEDTNSALTTAISGNATVAALGHHRA